MLTLVDVLAIRSPERERLVEADEAIRDLARMLEAGAQSQGLDHQTISRALVGVLIAAAAGQAIKAYPSMSKAEIGAALSELAEEAVEWAARRALEPAVRKGRDAPVVS